MLKNTHLGILAILLLTTTGCTNMQSYTPWGGGDDGYAQATRVESDGEQTPSEGQSGLNYTSLPMASLPVGLPSQSAESMKTDVTMLSNESVIVYSLDGDIKGTPHRDFPKDGGMRGGYTVFDPSVQVFSIDGSGQKPDYMPHYAVPTYDAKKNDIKSSMNMNAATAVEQRPLLPLIPLAQSEQPLIPSAPPAQAIRQPRTSSPLAGKLAMPIKKTDTAERRSAPVLTSYD